MKLIVDLQACQTPTSRFRGIGRYSLSLTQAMARNAGSHELWVAVSNRYRQAALALEEDFRAVLPPGRVLRWGGEVDIAEIHSESAWRRLALERVRSAFLRGHQPDAVHVSSLFEGLDNDACHAIEPGVGACQGVTLYDLIPYRYPGQYLATERVAEWYRNRLTHLRHADVLLSISEASRNDAINLLGIPEHFVTNISCDVDPIFRVLGEEADEMERSVRSRYGLTKPFLMYTGGIDSRKNLQGLIESFALLPGEMRERFQLAIVCAASAKQKESLLSAAAKCGLPAESLVVTGFVSDEELVVLYNRCDLFVFPSWHEGFGMPVLEAMRCGAPVIGSDCSSIPEIIQWDEALFDPRRPQAIAERMAHALRTPAFLSALRRHGLERARAFSWDISARRAWGAYEKAWDAGRRLPAAPRKQRRARRRLAYVSPLPPEASGVADFSAELLPALAEHYEIDAVTSSPVRQGCLPSGIELIDIPFFEQTANRYDRVIYHVGNSDAHAPMLRLLRSVPGTVDLHDFFLSGLYLRQPKPAGLPDALCGELLRWHGGAALARYLKLKPSPEALLRYPANLGVVAHANGVIVHSSHAQDLARDWYGEAAARNWGCVRLARARRPLPSRDEARRRLGIAAGTFLFCSFGHVAGNKLSDRLLAAWLQSRAASSPDCRLVFVGAAGKLEERNLRKMAGAHAAGARVRLSGFASPEEYDLWLAAADAAIQLRSRSGGEASASVLDAMMAGLPVVVNRHGSLAEFPEGVVLPVPDHFEAPELAAAIDRVHSDAGLRTGLGARAASHVGELHDPARIAAEYVEWIERFAQTGPQVPLLVAAEEIRRLGPPLIEEDMADLVGLARDNLCVEPTSPPIVLVDVSLFVSEKKFDPKLREKLLARLDRRGERVELVYWDEAGRCRRAGRLLARMLGLPARVQIHDSPMILPRAENWLSWSDLLEE